MTRRRRRLLVGFLLVAGVAGLGLLAHRWTTAFAVRALSAFFHRPSSVREIRFHLLPFGAEILDLRVEGWTRDDPPSLEVPRIFIVPSVGSLFSPRLVLARVRLERPKIRIHAFPAAGDDIPPMGGGGGGPGTEVRIHRLLIEGGEFILHHERVPLDLDLPDFSAKLLAKRGGALGGTVSFGPGRLRFGSAPELTVGTELQLVLNGSLVTVESARVTTPSQTALAYQGEIHLAKDPVGTLSLNGPVDLGELDQHVLRTGFGLQGAAHFVGSLGIDGPRLSIRGRLEGTRGVFEGASVPRFASQVDWRAGRVILDPLEITTLGGTATLHIDVAPEGQPTRLTATLQGIDAEGALMPLFSIGAAGLGASGTGEVALQWPRGRMRALSGRIGLDFAPASDGRTPLAGRFEWRAEKGVQFVDLADFRTPTTRARFQGRIEPDDRTDMSADGESTDLAATDELSVRIRRALGAVDPQRVAAEGAGVFRGRWTGTLHDPVYSGRFTGQSFRYRDVDWGQVEWSGVSDGTALTSHSLVVRRSGAEIWLDGRTETGDYGESDQVDLRVRYSEWPAADFLKAFSWRIDYDGPVSGQARLIGRRSALRGEARIQGSAGHFYGVPFSDLDLAAVLREGVTEATAGRARVGGGTVRFKGTLTDEGVYDGTIAGEDVDAGTLVAAPAPQLLWGGAVSGEVVFAGTLARPRLKGHVTSPHLFLGEEGFGSLDATLQAQGDGAVSLDARCRSPRLELSLLGRVEVAAPHAARLTLKVSSTSFDPFLRAVLPSLPPGVGIVATGEATLDGPLATPRQLRAQVVLASLEVVVPDYPVRSQGPAHLSVESGHLTLEKLHMAGEGTDLVVEGTVDVAGPGPLGISVRGEADLRALSLITRRLRGVGSARLAMTVAGTRSAPRVEGSLALEGAGVRVRGFPHGLEGMRGTVSFTETAAHFSGMTGRLGGGDVELEGQAAYAQGRLVSFDIRASGRALSLRYPEGLRSVVDADLRAFGGPDRQWLTGTVDVRQSLWTRRYDLASELLATGHGWEGGSTSLSDTLRYDIKVRAPGTLKIDNNLATLQARADLTLQGSYDDPIILGRTEIDRGRVYFQGNTYVIRRGTIDFANPQKIDPLFDIEAETRIKSYRVTLKMNGTLERVYPTLTSDPPLTAVQILNLLAGADETAVASLSQSQTDQAKLAATGAATLAAGRISEQVGLERGAERIFGLNRFSIDPSLVKGGVSVTNPTARLTVGKRVTPDLSVLYSVDLRGTDERLLSVEYTLSDRFSLLLTRAEPGGFGIDVRLRQSR